VNGCRDKSIICPFEHPGNEGITCHGLLAAKSWKPPGELLIEGPGAACRDTENAAELLLGNYDPGWE